MSSSILSMNPFKSAGTTRVVRMVASEHGFGAGFQSPGPAPRTSAPDSASQREPKSWPLSAALATSRHRRARAAGSSATPASSANDTSSRQLSGLGWSVYAQYRDKSAYSPTTSVARVASIVETRTIFSGRDQYACSRTSVGSASRARRVASDIGISTSGGSEPAKDDGLFGSSASESDASSDGSGGGFAASRAASPRVEGFAHLSNRAG